MVIFFEFLGNDPVENVITCMNFHADKCIFFGYRNTIERQRKSTENFLRKYCRVSQIVFIAVPEEDLYQVEAIIRSNIEREGVSGNRIYFDITGGEDLILVAFGMLAREFNIPMHSFNIEEGRLIDFDEDQPFGISHSNREQHVMLDLDRYIELRGGVINYSMRKNIKNLKDPDFDSDARAMWKVAVKHSDYWTSFSAFLRGNMIPEKDLLVERKKETVIEALKKDGAELKTEYRLNSILDDLAEAGILTEYSRGDDRYHFRFRNEMVKDCLWDGGSILEIHTYQIEKTRSDDCMVGVHLDWDGVLHTVNGADVFNEIDVLCLNGYIPTFISCKNGKMSGGTTLHALYELSIVAERFGGSRARKVLVTTQSIGEVYKKRAREMNIEVR